LGGGKKGIVREESEKGGKKGEIGLGNFISATHDPHKKRRLKGKVGSSTSSSLQGEIDKG